MSANQSQRLTLSLSTIALAVTAALSSMSAAAQGDGVEEVTVTGTRIRRDADYNTPNPTTTVDGDYLRNLGIVNVGDAIQQNPTNVTRFSAQTTGSGSFFVGTQMANLRGLNPYFGTRTLTLVDSKRHVPTNQGGSVDLNFIPSVIIDRMETITGGASASYGSDAVTGVVNILLDKTMTGLKLEADYGFTGEGDGESTHVGIGGGTELFDGRGHVVVGYEYQHQKPIFDCYSARDWCAEGLTLFQNSLTGTSQTDNPAAFANPLIPGQPHLILMGDLRSGTHPNGLLSDRRAGATRYRFNDEGTSLVPYDAGQFSQVSNTRAVVGGEGRPTYEMQTLMPDIERNIIYTHFNYDVTENLKFFTDFSYGKVDSANQQAAASTTVMCIRPDNAYLGTLDATSRNLILGAIGQQITNGALAACNTSGGAGSGVPFTPGATLTKDFRPQQDQGISNTAEATRLVVGVEGLFANTDTWSWDAYYQYGKATRDQIAADYITTYRFQMALDSVINPLTGQPDCRVNVAAPGTEQTVYPQRFMDPFLVQGCVPLNPFGQQMSEAAHNYAFDPLEEFNTIDQQVIAGGVNGELWKGWGAGPLLTAAGLEYRYEKMDNDTYKDRPREHSLDTSVSFGTNWAGESEVAEAFAEFEMPLLANKPLARNWVLNYAVRRTHYDMAELERSGGTLTGNQEVTTWKFQSVWEPTDYLRVRGSRSRDIRAAGFRELYYQQYQQKGATSGRITNNFNNNTPNDETLIILSGYENLVPEKADTTTFGFVISPKGKAEGLQVSIDYYSIELEDGIKWSNGQRIVDNCYQEYTATASLAGQYCSLIEFAEVNGVPDLFDVEFVLAPHYNDAPYESTGFDFTTSYRLNMNSGNAIDIRLLASRALEQNIQVGTAPRLERDLAGMVGGAGALQDYAPYAEWTANLMVGFSRGPLRITTQGRYVSSGFIDLATPYVGPDDPRYNPALQNSIDSNVVPSHITQNLNVSYDFAFRGTTAQVWAGVNNMWDKDPPFATGPTGGRNGAYHDILGRSYKVGVRFDF